MGSGRKFVHRPLGLNAGRVCVCVCVRVCVCGRNRYVFHIDPLEYAVVDH